MSVGLLIVVQPYSNDSALCVSAQTVVLCGEFCETSYRSSSWRPEGDSDSVDIIAVTPECGEACGHEAEAISFDGP